MTATLTRLVTAVTVSLIHPPAVRLGGHRRGVPSSIDVGRRLTRRVTGCVAAPDVTLRVRLARRLDRPSVTATLLTRPLLYSVVLDRRHATPLREAPPSPTTALLLPTRPLGRSRGSRRAEHAPALAAPPPLRRLVTHPPRMNRSSTSPDFSWISNPPPPSGGEGETSGSRTRRGVDHGVGAAEAQKPQQQNSEPPPHLSREQGFKRQGQSYRDLARRKPRETRRTPGP